MGPGFKYHIVTIAAIFFALTVGLVIGSLTVSPVMVRSYEAQLKGLKSSLNLDLNDKSQQIKHLNEAVHTMLPTVLGGKLNGQAVAIVQTGDYTEQVGGIRDALTSAGAHITSITTIQPLMDRTDPALTQELGALHQQEPLIPLDRQGTAGAIASALTHGDALSESVMAALQRSELVSSEADSVYQAPVSLIVVLAGSRTEGTDRPTNVDGPIVKALQQQGAVVVMCEPEHAAVSDVPAYHALGLQLATVDNVDSDIGACSLVYSLLGAAGDYGVKSAARDLLPPLTAPAN